MNADGSAGVDAGISAGAKVPFLGPIAWGSIGAPPASTARTTGARSISAAGPSSTTWPLSTVRRQPSAPRTRLSIVSRATLAIDGNASPRKPSVSTISIASSGSLEVACRSSASAISGGLMPLPSSVTSSPAMPPSHKRMEMRVAPASIAFSTSSLSALAGRSTTSPAAMRLIRSSGRRRIDMGQSL